MTVWLESESMSGIGVRYDFNPMKQIVMIDDHGKEYLPLSVESVGDKSFSGQYLASSYIPSIISGKITFPMVDNTASTLNIVFRNIDSKNVYGAVLDPFTFSYEVNIKENPIIIEAQ